MCCSLFKKICRFWSLHIWGVWKIGVWSLNYTTLGIVVPFHYKEGQYFLFGRGEGGQEGFLYHPQIHWKFELPPEKSKYFFAQIFGLWYSSEAYSKCAKNVPKINQIRLNRAEQFKKINLSVSAHWAISGAHMILIRKNPWQLCQMLLRVYIKSDT